MRRTIIIVLAYAILIFVHGCSSINVGGSGQIGTVIGGGSVSIPIPK